MKVKLNITLDIDPEKWATEFSLDHDRSIVREDVQVYFEGLCHSQVDTLGVFKERE